MKYLKENNLNIKKLYSISGFNGRLNIPEAEEYDYVNESFFIDDFENNKVEITQSLKITKDGP